MYSRVGTAVGGQAPRRPGRLAVLQRLQPAAAERLEHDRASVGRLLCAAKDPRLDGPVGDFLLPRHRRRQRDVDRAVNGITAGVAPAASDSRWRWPPLLKMSALPSGVNA